MKKASISLSINFIVVLIISLVVMSLGFGLLKKMITKGNEGIQGSSEQLQKEVEKVLTSQNSPIFIAPRQAEVDAGNPAVFVLGIRNLKPNQKQFAYGVQIVKAYDEQNNDLSKPSWTILAQENNPDYDALLSPSHPSVTFLVDSRAITKKTIVIKVPNDAIPGTYIYDVKVTFEEGGNWQLYDQGKLYVIVH